MHPLRLSLVVLPALLGAAVARAEEPAPGMHGTHATHEAAPIVVEAGVTPVALPQYGIEIVAIRLTAAKSMLDLRYRVLDPAKAKKAMDAATPLALRDEASGTDLVVPVDEQVGAMRQSGSNIRPGQVLADLFGNPGRIVKAGDKVTLRIGDVTVTHLKVEG